MERIWSKLTVKMILRIIACFLILFPGTRTQATDFERLGIEEGLSHPWAKSFVRDNYGNIWIGTLDGLNKYDGTAVTIYRNDPDNPGSLSDNFIQSLAADQQGYIWIGTESGGLNRYNPQKDSFKHYTASDREAGRLISNNITALFVDETGRLWVGTHLGLCLYDQDNDQFVRHPLAGLGADIDVRVRDIYEDHLNQIWVATDEGLHVTQLENRTLRSFDDSNSPLPKLPITSIYEDEQNQIWIGVLGGGVFRKSTGEEFERYYTGNGRLQNDGVLTVIGNQNGKIYIGTEGGGLHFLDLPTGKITVESFDPNREKSLVSNSIHALHYDHQADILWVGTYHGGVNFFSQWSKEIEYLDIPDLNNNYILSISESPEGDIYVGTDGGGINILRKSGAIDRMNASNSPLTSDVILSSLFDTYGNIWIGTFLGGLVYQPGDSRKARTFIPEGSGSIPGKNINALYRDRQNRLWIGTMNEGLAMLLPQSNRFVNYRVDAAVSESISNNYINEIAERATGEILVLTGSGLDIFDEETGAFRSLLADYEVDVSGPICFHQDDRERIWLGARNGLFCLMPDGRAKRFTREDNLPSNFIASIEEDQQGNLWLGTQRGLVKAIGAVNDPERVAFHVFTKEDGLPGLNFRPRSSCRLTDGRLVFGGNHGVVYFDPEKIWLNPVKPYVTFTSFKLFNETVDFRASEILEQPIQFTEEIRLNYDQNIFSVDYTSSNFLIPSKNKFSHKLEGFDQDWGTPSNQRTISYTNIPPGDYTLMVKSANNDGIWNEEPATLRIVIVPPWWTLTWVRVLAILFLVSMIALAFTYRVNEYKKRHVVLNEKIAEATREIQKVNELLASKNEDLSAKNELLLQQNHALENQAEKIQKLNDEIQENNEGKLKFFTNVSHELRTPLTLILGPLNELSEDRNSPNQETYGLMLDNANRLLRTVNQLLDFRKLETGNVHLVVRKTNVVQFARDIFDSFTYLATKRKVTYKFHSDSEHCVGLLDTEKMEKVLMNLLSNAFKFTPDGGRIKVALQCSDELELTITDSGRGIKKENLTKIFDLYFKGNQYGDDQGTGIGLALIKQYVELHHGDILVESEIGTGSVFTVTLPLDEAAYESDERLPDDESLEDFRPTLEIDLEDEPVDEDELVEDQRPYSLLVVEDNADIRKYIRKAMSGDFKIIEAANGEEGLKATWKYMPDFIISDIMMPEMTGTEMCRKIKENPETAHIPVTLLTAYSGEENKKDGFFSGADDYTVKPFDIHVLRAKMLNKAKTRSNFLEKFKKHTSLDVSAVAGAEGEGFIKQAIAKVEENLSNTQFGVEDFSQALNMSRRNLLRKVKTKTGLSVNEFIRNIRLKRAAELLRKGEYNISEVAYMTGFNDPKYFSKCFHREFEQSPSDFLKENV